MQQRTSDHRVDVVLFVCCSIECANLQFRLFFFTKIDFMTNSTKNALRQKCHAFRHIRVDLLWSSFRKPRPNRLCIILHRRVRRRQHVQRCATCCKYSTSTSHRTICVISPFQLTPVHRKKRETQGLPTCMPP
jgi:hypothetical protein